MEDRVKDLRSITAKKTSEVGLYDKKEKRSKEQSRTTGEKGF